MEKIAVIYWSGTGNTETMANAIATGIAEAGATPVLFSVDSFKENIIDYAKIAFGCPSMGDEVLEETEFEPFFESIENRLGGKKVALFGSYGWGDGQWMKNWQERVEEKNAILYEEGLIVNGAPDDAAKGICTHFGKSFAQY